MIEFKIPELSDRPWMDKMYRCSGFRGCEYSFASLFIWCGTYNQKLARIGGHLSVHMEAPGGVQYLYPAGCGDIKPVIIELAGHSKLENTPLKLVGVTDKGINTLNDLFPGCFSYEELRYSFDYIYEVDRLADLNGKKLHAKRTHINRFAEAYPDWQFKLIRSDTLHECVKIYEDWLSRMQEGEIQFGMDFERLAMTRAFEYFFDLGLDGGILYAGNRPVAFTIGERINEDTFAVHFEKAYSDIQGAYTVINREFAKFVRAKYGGVKYINREEDMGVPGLRRAKLSYYPDILLAKYRASQIKSLL